MAAVRLLTLLFAEENYFLQLINLGDAGIHHYSIPSQTWQDLSAPPSPVKASGHVQEMRNPVEGG